MEEKNEDILIDKIEELNDIEQSVSKVFVVLYLKNVTTIRNHKIQLFKLNFENQLDFYNQNMEKYKIDYENALKKYENLLDEIINEYNQLYINEQLELQEAEANKKIAILNIVKLYNKKQKILQNDESNICEIEEIDGKIKDNFAKKINYDGKIDECENALRNCMEMLNKQVDKIFKDYSYDLVPAKSKKIKDLLNKIVNKFSGASKFNTYVLEPIKIENEKIECIIPDIIEDIEQKKIEFLTEINELEKLYAISA